MSTIVAFAGSTRRDSYNRRLLDAATRGREAAVTVLDLSKFELPLYNGDLETSEGMPAAALELKRIFSEHAGMLIACPEYNGSITPLLKNTLDWVSRPSPDLPDLEPYKGKTAALLSASPGGFGGMRGLVHVRAILSGIGVLVLPDQLAVPRAHEAFSEDGSLADERLAKRLNGVVDRLTATVDRLA